MGKDNDDDVYVIHLYHPSHTSCIGLKAKKVTKSTSTHRLPFVHMTKSA